MKLYEFAPTRSIRARWALQELGVDFEPVTVNLAAGENRRPEFLEINPAGKLPVLVDGDVLDGFPQLQAYIEQMYARPSAPPRISVALASVRRATS